MKTTTHLGIWMDHSVAHLIDVTSESSAASKIDSEFTPKLKGHMRSKGEFMMHNDEQQKQHAFYLKIGEAIKKYDHVVIFGPTHAKEELHNLLKKDRHFENILIEVKHADKMTDAQQQAFAKDHFKTSVYSRKVM